MARKRHTPEEIIGKPRAVKVELAKGQSALQSQNGAGLLRDCRSLGDAAALAQRVMKTR